MTDDPRTDPHRPARTAGERDAEANPATANTSAYSLRAAAGLLIIVVFGGLPTLVEGQPMWAAIAGLVGVIVGFVMLALAVTGIVKTMRARRGR
ncbi:hypothetical protein [Corynebacterium sp. 335C]